MTFPIEWDFESVNSRYATNMVIQAGENEFFLSFFEIRPPVMFSPDDREKIKSVKAECVARVIVPADKLQTFIDTMQKNLNNHLTAPLTPQDDNDDSVSD